MKIPHPSVFTNFQLVDAEILAKMSSLIEAHRSKEIGMNITVLATLQEAGPLNCVITVGPNCDVEVQRDCGEVCT